MRTIKEFLTGLTFGDALIVLSLVLLLIAGMDSSKCGMSVSVKTRNVAAISK